MKITMTTPEAHDSGRHTVDFVAPPPSPVGPGRRSSLTNDDVLTEYLHQSLKVPNLILPDRVFPKQKSNENPPILDFQKLEAIEGVSELIANEAGCLEVINHGVSRDFIKLVMDSGGGVFEISQEKKREAARSPERRWGFEEVHGEEEEVINYNGGVRDESDEEFVWCGEEKMGILEMVEGIWPNGYSNFSEKLEKLSDQIEEVGGKILAFLEHYSLRKFDPENDPTTEQVVGKLCYIHKHCRKTDDEQCEDSLRYDVIRMLIRGSEFPHALCLHLCIGSTEFHVYSKKGWISFCPNPDSIVVTFGDKLQAWSGGQYKHVIGRPVFRGGNENYISMNFLYSPPKATNSIKDNKHMTISISQQIIIYILLTILYQFISHIYNIIFRKFKH